MQHVFLVLWLSDGLLWNTQIEGVTAQSCVQKDLLYALCTPAMNSHPGLKTCFELFSEVTKRKTFRSGQLLSSHSEAAVLFTARCAESYLKHPRFRLWQGCCLAWLQRESWLEDGGSKCHPQTSSRRPDLSWFKVNEIKLPVIRLFARERELTCWYPKFSCAFPPTLKLQMAFDQQKGSGKHLQPGKLICSLLLPWERNSLCYNRELVFASVNKITSETPRRPFWRAKKSFMNLLCCQDSVMQTDAASPSTDSA